MSHAGGDDRRVMLWNTEKALDEHGQPREMLQEHNSNIFALAFDRDNRKIMSGGVFMLYSHCPAPNIKIRLIKHCVSVLLLFDTV